MTNASQTVLGERVAAAADLPSTAYSLQPREAQRLRLLARLEAGRLLTERNRLGQFATPSRLAEEIVIWSCEQFGFRRLADAFSTGSSIMPQKRNPDGAELLRARAARVAADHLALLEIQRALPAA